MYVDSKITTTQKPRAWHCDDDPGVVWFGVLGHFSAAVSPYELDELIAELIRERSVMVANKRVAA